MKPNTLMSPGAKESPYKLKVSVLAVLFQEILLNVTRNMLFKGNPTAFSHLTKKKLERNW